MNYEPTRHNWTRTAYLFLSLCVLSFLKDWRLSTLFPFAVMYSKTNSISALMVFDANSSECSSWLWVQCFSMKQLQQFVVIVSLIRSWIESIGFSRTNCVLACTLIKSAEGAGWKGLGMHWSLHTVLSAGAKTCQALLNVPSSETSPNHGWFLKCGGKRSSVSGYGSGRNFWTVFIPLT